MRLAGRVPQHRAALGRRPRPSARSRCPVTLGSSRKMSAPTSRLGLELVAVADGDRGAELLEREEVGVHPAPADDVTAGRRQGRPCRSGRACGPASRIDARIRAQSVGSSGLGRTRARVDAHRVRRRSTRPWRRDPASSASMVSTSRMRGMLSSSIGAVGEHGGGEDRQRGVLVAGGTDGAAQRTTAANEKAWRHGQSCRGRLQRVKRKRGGCGCSPTPLFSRMRDVAPRDRRSCRPF